MFIELTNQFGDPIAINIKCIESFGTIAHGEFKGLTFIIPNGLTETLSDGEYYIVKESVKDIVRQLNAFFI